MSDPAPLTPELAAETANVLREPPVDDKIQRGVDKGLNRVFTDSLTLELEPRRLSELKLVIFSDHHRGVRDGTDDFLRCERAYNAALGYYLEFGHHLIVVGDAEELWQCKPAKVLEAYEATYKLEAAFFKSERYEKIWGNHDDHWQVATSFASLQADFRSLQNRQALKLPVVDDDDQELGLLFLVHGHQGTKNSDQYSWFSRRFVRHVWRPIQRRSGYRATTPAVDFELRGAHDVAMYSWARRHAEKPVLIAGHTHRPVFWTSRPPQAS